MASAFHRSSTEMGETSHTIIQLYISLLNIHLGLDIISDRWVTSEMRKQSRLTSSVNMECHSYAVSCAYEAAPMHLQVLEGVQGWKQVSNEPALCMQPSL